MKFGKICVNDSYNNDLDEPLIIALVNLFKFLNITV